MGFADKSIVCVDCGKAFTITAARQELRAARGRTKEPQRCPECRKAKRQQRRSSRGESGINI